MVEWLSKFFILPNSVSVSSSPAVDVTLTPPQSGEGGGVTIVLVVVVVAVVVVGAAVVVVVVLVTESVDGPVDATVDAFSAFRSTMLFR